VRRCHVIWANLEHYRDMCAKLGDTLLTTLFLDKRLWIFVILLEYSGGKRKKYVHLKGNIYLTYFLRLACYGAKMWIHLWRLMLIW